MQLSYFTVSPKQDTFRAAFRVPAAAGKEETIHISGTVTKQGNQLQFSPVWQPGDAPAFSRLEFLPGGVYLNTPVGGKRKNEFFTDRIRPYTLRDVIPPSADAESLYRTYFHAKIVDRITRLIYADN